MRLVRSASQLGLEAWLMVRSCSDSQDLRLLQDLKAAQRSSKLEARRIRKEI